MSQAPVLARSYPALQHSVIEKMVIEGKKCAGASQASVD